MGLVFVVLVLSLVKMEPFQHTFFVEECGTRTGKFHTTLVGGVDVGVGVGADDAGVILLFNGGRAFFPYRKPFGLQFTEAVRVGGLGVWSLVVLKTLERDRLEEAVLFGEEWEKDDGKKP